MNITRIIAGVRQRLLAAFYNRKENDTFVLMLHEVTDKEPAMQPELSITKQGLSELLDAISESGVVFDSIENIQSKNGKRVIVTFDDIFESAYRNAFPLLHARKIPYTVFVSSEYVGKPAYITEEALEELKQEPLCTIGFHANSHVLMRDLSNQEIAENVRARSFEEKFGLKCTYFAFPYGSVYACPRRAVSIAAKQGYRGVFSTINSAVSTRYIERNPWFIPRLCVSDHTWKNIVKKM